MEDISPLPAPEPKFEGRKSDYLGQLIVTPTIVSKKIRDMKKISHLEWMGFLQSNFWKLYDKLAYHLQKCSIYH